MTCAATIAEIDAYVAEGRGGYRGWHEENEEGPNYRPMLQQNRTEFCELMHCLDRVRTPSWSTMIQLGLGHPGGSHWAFRRLFDHVISVDPDHGAISKYLALNGSEDRGSTFLDGRSCDDRVTDFMRSLVHPVDAVFIDGDHTADGVRTDWVAYKDRVRVGGIVAFHDTAAWKQDPPGCAVPMFINWLGNNPDEIGGAALHHLIHPDLKRGVGISFYYRRP